MIKRVQGEQTVAGTSKQETHPSLMSFASRSRYAFHLSPMTLPQEKHRTGMICTHTIR